MKPCASSLYNAQLLGYSADTAQGRAKSATFWRRNLRHLGSDARVPAHVEKQPLEEVLRRSLKC